MNNVAKKILAILLTIVFIFSVLFNVLCFKSSYASLLFSYDEDLYSTMASNALSRFYYQNITALKNSGVQIKTNNVGSCSEATLDIYFDSDSKPTLKHSCKKVSESEIKTTYTYFYDDVVYFDNGTKTKTTSTFLQTYSSYGAFLPLNQVIDEKAKTAISFNSKYILGIKYGYKENETTYIYKYDLKGKLRDVSITNGDETTASYKISYKNSSIALPDLSEYK